VNRATAQPFLNGARGIKGRITCEMSFSGITIAIIISVVCIAAVIVIKIITKIQKPRLEQMLFGESDRLHRGETTEELVG